MTPEEIAKRIIDEYWDLNDSRPDLIDDIAAALRSYGDERARPGWQPIEPKPADWDAEYHVPLTGKNLEAMHYLARFVLDKVRDPHPLPFGVIASADHLFCLAADIRRTPPD